MMLLSREDVYAIDKKLIPRQMTEFALIELVGKKLANWFLENGFRDAKILVIVGPGNNGLDGLSLVKNLLENSCEVQYLELYPEARRLKEFTSALGFNTERIKRSLETNFDDFDVVVDGIFGVGLNGPVDTRVSGVLERMNKFSGQKVAIDIATGIDANTGAVLGSCFSADITLSIGGAKAGQYLLPGCLKSGEVKLIEIPLISKEMQSVKTQIQSLEYKKEWGKCLLPLPESHKYKNGKVSFIMSKDFPGAVLLGAMAAQAIGVGYVQVYCPQELLVQCQICYPSFIFIGFSDYESLYLNLEEDKSQSLVIGSGWVKALNDFPLQESKTYIVDGGFLTSSFVEKCKQKTLKDIILTPHLGELKRVLGPISDELSKLEMLGLLLENFSGVVVAKGYDSLVCQQGQSSRLSLWNAPSLATAGSGDILCGMIAALSARGLNSFDATSFAVELQRRVGLEFSLLSSPLKLIDKIQPVLESLLQDS